MTELNQGQSGTNQVAFSVYEHAKSGTLIFNYKELFSAAVAENEEI